jgi:hypothetical protein
LTRYSIDSEVSMATDVVPGAHQKSAAGKKSVALEKQLVDLIDRCELDPHQKMYMRRRWLDQVLWFERRAETNQRRFYLLRIMAIVGGVVVPALVSLNLTRKDIESDVVWTTFAISLVVGIAIAIDGFFDFGGRWREYRRTSELLKASGWEFFELAGPFANYSSNRAAFGSFVVVVEGLISHDVAVYLAKLMGGQVGTPPSQGGEGTDADADTGEGNDGALTTPVGAPIETGLREGASGASQTGGVDPVTSELQGRADPNSEPGG